jgi:hypothetical protein
MPSLGWRRARRWSRSVGNKQGHRHSRGRGPPQDPQPSPGGREEGSPLVAGAVVATGSGAGGDAVASSHEETIAGCRLLRPSLPPVC